MTFDDFKTIVSEVFPEMGREQLGQFAQMPSLYEEWNAKINVISRKDITNLYEHHVLHSLAIAVYMKEKQPGTYDSFVAGGLNVLDLGTGGGFPGIPLAIMFPSTHFILCDSVGKKIKVAASIAESLGLKNIETANSRAEALTGPYDYVVSRAVASLETFYPWVKGKVANDIFYLKGGEINEEIAALMGKFRISKGRIGTWQVDNWLPGEYYEGKFVIHIRK